ncbi:hypothetical protein TOT_040000790 [Theileria orientalis strain Shintoku]|uniref:Uncharacterized protein n=1 Tax=Theileria orientalis strain Shintoku TaxID=869250 RepID=J7M8M4_THEOR|nr:LOW QUALITY PROTEIN: hypothetical protein TOT_040000790 [Theileria orientalis strain Shintoku]BAM42423.1 hypothetical protein TOT_040000790 [Theileria orientalis strain Shintoku]|eukprot:XP_009692724.1 LOW QUALITY PROTEIN: hypothetical protein TOT_040000790 [Theileria orientalis strain Shintoku]
MCNIDNYHLLNKFIIYKHFTNSTNRTATQNNSNERLKNSKSPLTLPIILLPLLVLPISNQQQANNSRPSYNNSTTTVIQHDQHLFIRTKNIHLQCKKMFTVSCEFKCPELAKYRYKCLRHKVTRLEAVYFNRIGGIKLRLKRNNGGRSSNRVIQILLYEESIQYRKTQTDICVYFYGCDPRPLIICFCGCWYRPKSKDAYCEQWECVPEFQGMGKCVCLPGSRVGTTCKTHEKLLCELTKVVGFLNTVDLFQHPKGTAGGEAGQTTCQPCEPGAAGATATCQAPTSGQTAGKCTYTVHKFDGKPIRVQVTCQDVQGTQPSESTAQTCTQTPGSGCYRKLTHKPAGLGNGSGDVGDTANGNGFRLGDVVYRGNGCTPEKCSIKYYGNCSDSVGNGNISDDHKWSPLLQVTVYYYNEDKGHCDPLLVELEFAKVAANGLQNGANDNKEYYRLKTRNGSGGKLEWAKVDNGSKLGLAKPGCLTRYLDGIRYCLKKVVRIQLQCKGTNGGQGYALEGRNAKNGQGQFSKINGVSQNGEVKVQVCECPKLTGYKCYQHKLGDALNGKHHLVAGLAFTLPGKNGGAGANGGTNGVVEIPVCVVGQGEAECPPGATEGLCTTTAPAAPEPTASCSAVTGAPTTGTQIPPVHYNQCMGDVYVYFYAGASASGSETGTTTDTVPLMLRYNGQFYRPCDRDQYFTKWVPVTALCKLAGECKGGCACCPGVRAAAPGTSCGTPVGSGDGADCPPECPCCSKLANELDGVNEALNRVDLDPEKASKAGSGGSSGAGTGYGLPESNGGNGGHKLAETVGNNRVCLTKQEPTGADAKKAYVKVVHRTKNGFRIGQLMYCGKEITQDGVNLGFLKNGQCDGPALSNGQTCSASAPASAEPGNDTIEVAKGTGGRNGNGNHKGLAKTCGWNTVVAYYSCSDQCYRLPQLIVLLRTDNPVNSAPVKSSNGKKYGWRWRWVGKYGVRVPVASAKPPETPVKLDDKTDFSLLNAAVILTEWTKDKSGGKYCDEQIKKAVESAIKSQSELKSPGHSGDVNRLTGKTITVTEEPGEGAGAGTHQCLDGTGFRVMTHDLTPFVKLNGPFKDKLNGVTLITGLKFVIPDSGETGSYKSVKLCPNGDDTSCSNEERHYYINGNTKIHVFFYGSDPRPLILCCNGVTYKPQKRSDPLDVKQVFIYYDKWFKDSSIDKCRCNGPDPGATGGKNALLQALVTVVGFLNPVQLNPRQIPKDACQQMTKEPPQSPPGNNTTYELHEFTSSIKIKMKIERKTVDCYGQYTYEPAGVNGTGTGNGFRLGDVMYTSITRTNQPNKLNYYNNGKNISTENKWNPLMKVVVYYYNQDRDYREPLLVILEFKNGVPKGSEIKEHYKLKEPGQVKVEWEKETREAGELSSQDTLIQYLHRLRYQFKKVVKLEVWHNKADCYKLKGRDGKNGYLGSDFQALDDKQIEVKEEQPCPLPNGTGYKCFKHDMTSLGAEMLHQIGGVRFYTRSAYNTSEVELKLHNGKPISGPIYEIYYNSCMGDIYVYFYDKDPRPLLLCYNREAYHANNMDDYDNQKWHKDAAAGKCDCPKPPNGNSEALLKALVRVSNFLNPVKIKSVYDDSNTYSIHWFNMQPIKITVKTQKADESFCYLQYTHTHYGIYSDGSGFRLGDIQYEGKCITENSNTKTLNGNKCISASDVNNDDTTPKTYKSASQVVVFYYKHDHKLFSPVLVALCEKSDTSVTCKQYYVLKDRDKKVYEKGKKTLDLSNKDKLGEELDRALFNNSKKLQIVLSTRPVPTEYKPDPDSAKGYSSDQKALEDELKKRRSEKAKLLKEVAKEADELEKTSKTTATNALTAGKPLATRDSLMHHVTGSTTYKAQLSNGASEPPSGPTTTQIPVEEVHCPGLQPGGYRCFKHELVSAKEMEYNDTYLYILLHSTGCYKFYYT